MRVAQRECERVMERESVCERERRGLCGSDPSLLSKVQPNWWLVGTREEMNVVWERGGGGVS